MAYATKMSKVVVVEKIVPDGVTLNLSHEEARVLKIILSKVAGHPDRTLRGYQTRISDALEDAGYKFNFGDMDAIEGGLTFTKNCLGMVPTDFYR